MNHTQSTTSRRALTVLVMAILLVGLTACDSSRIDGVPEGPVSDAELLTQIKALDHVVDATLEYHISVSNGDSYDAFVTIDSGGEVDSFCMMDQVAAILWMGRKTAFRLAVKEEGTAQGVYDDQMDVGPEMWALEGSLAERYGPRPEPGSNPTPAPAPACA